MGSTGFKYITLSKDRGESSNFEFQPTTTQFPPINQLVLFFISRNSRRLDAVVVLPEAECVAHVADP